jgi:D-hexose-6-phosphate mutarotase
MKVRGIIELCANDGARSIICLHGGQVIGWHPAGQDADVLFLSKRSVRR